jgi:hypothetical protein
MRKLIEFKQDGIQCDNLKCDFAEECEHYEIISYINKPCPKCGENLLTREDFYRYLKVLKFIQWINKWFSWLLLLEKLKFWRWGKPINYQEVEVGTHKKITIDVKNVK